MTAPHKKKRKTRRRTLSPQPQAAGSPELRLRWAGRVTTALGVLALVAAVAIQFGMVAVTLDPRAVLILKFAGVGLVLAGFVFSRR